MIETLMISAKLVAQGLLKRKVFWSKRYVVMIPANNVTNKILSPDSNNTIGVVMLPKFGNCSISMREVIIISFL